MSRTFLMEHGNHMFYLGVVVFEEELGVRIIAHVMGGREGGRGRDGRRGLPGGYQIP